MQTIFSNLKKYYLLYQISKKIDFLPLFLLFPSFPFSFLLFIFCFELCACTAPSWERRRGDVPMCPPRYRPVKWEMGCRATMSPTKWPPEPPNTQNNLKVPLNSPRASCFVSKPPHFWSALAVFYYFCNLTLTKNQNESPNLRPKCGAWRGSKRRGEGFARLGGHFAYQEAL